MEVQAIGGLVGAVPGSNLDVLIWWPFTARASDEQANVFLLSSSCRRIRGRSPHTHYQHCGEAPPEVKCSVTHTQSVK